MSKESDKNNIIKVFFVLLFVYVALFEFVLPVNKILPKPSLLIDSYISLFEDYNLLFASAITTTAVYLSLLLGYFIISLLSPMLTKVFVEIPGLLNGPRVFRYFPPLFFAILFVYWFNDSFIAELGFGLLFATFALGAKLYSAIDNVKAEYIDYSRGIGTSKNKIYSSVIWKCCQPKVFGEIKTIHYSLWIIILVYEFISTAGIGGIYQLALSYNDLAAFFSLAILISVLIFIGNGIINFLKEKIIYWEQ